MKCTIICTIANSAITNGNYEKADTWMLLHAKGASQSGMKKVLICTADTNIVAISIVVFEQMDLLELWLAIGTGSHL